jgi:hypothetical protein
LSTLCFLNSALTVFLVCPWEPLEEPFKPALEWQLD